MKAAAQARVFVCSAFPTTGARAIPPSPPAPGTADLSPRGEVVKMQGRSADASRCLEVRQSSSESLQVRQHGTL